MEIIGGSCWDGELKVNILICGFSFKISVYAICRTHLEESFHSAGGVLRPSSVIPSWENHYDTALSCPFRFTSYNKSINS